MKITIRQQQIIDIVRKNDSANISRIQALLSEDVSIPTLNRDLAFLVEESFLIRKGKGRGTTYIISPSLSLLYPIDLEAYFNFDLDERCAEKTFNFELLKTLKSVSIFSREELETLEELRECYQQRVKEYPLTLYRKELERLTIELSWKSSQIEGNTYSLLETELLFLEKEEAIGKPKEDAIMLLNHQKCIKLLLEEVKERVDLTVSFIERIHEILIKELGARKNIRSRIVGITGTNYKPLDNSYQIREALEKASDIINSKENGFEKALLAIALISYIQPFEDGNKRTARMISTALLIQHSACPLSYRSISALDYKKAMVLFYERNNLSALKRMFLEQCRFSSRNYFN